METISYDAYLAHMRAHWKLSEHIGLIAPTGSGKTFIARDLLGLKQHAVAIATKVKDRSLELYVKEDGFVYKDKWPPDWHEHHVVLWKKARELGDFAGQQALIYLTMNDIYKRGGYVLYFDDLFYVSETLHLKRPIQMLYTQVRSNGVSLIGAMQRPAWNPLEAVSQATYLIVFGIRDKRDIARVAEGAGLDPKELLTAIMALKQYEFLLLQSGHDPIHVEKRQKGS
jgi:energy-coupling factor transporter ATP-binding protein EcfA2